MIIVTGSTGVIGRALIARLKKEKFPYISLSSPEIRDPKSYGSISNSLDKPSVIVHLAAIVPKPPMILDDFVNAKLTREIDSHILSRLKLWNCHAIYASGCSLYGKSSDLEMKEEQAASFYGHQTSPYLTAKEQGERDFLATERSTVLRISAPLGTGISSATVVGRFIETAKAGRTIELWGSGTREQNYVDVQDIADAIVRAIVLRPIGLINVAANQPVTMLELAKKIVDICGTGSYILSGKSDVHDGEPARYSNRLARKILGWLPNINLHDSLIGLIKQNYENK